MNIELIGYAFLGGLLPAIIWLYFLLKEDSRCPEPRKDILLAFIAGMFMVPLAIWPENYVNISLSGGLTVLTAWAVIEETLKYLGAAIFILWRRAVDESPDYVIYMLTVALGFAAAENALFLLAPLAQGNIDIFIQTNNLRFLGSTLLHVVASSAIGFSLAVSYNLSPPLRTLFAVSGLILATALHTTFNALIIGESGSIALAAFFFVWIVAVIFFAAFEVLKYFRYKDLPKNTC